MSSGWQVIARTVMWFPSLRAGVSPNRQGKSRERLVRARIAGPFSAAIWTRDVLLLLGKVDLSMVVGGEKKLIDLFPKDYQEANPG
jgi:hypothetical protein